MISSYAQAEIEQDQAQSRQRDRECEEFQRKQKSCEEERAREPASGCVQGEAWNTAAGSRCDAPCLDLASASSELRDTKSVLGWEHQWLHSPFAMKADNLFFKNSALFNVESPLPRFKPSWSSGSMLAMDKTPTQTVQNLTLNSRSISSTDDSIVTGCKDVCCNSVEHPPQVGEASKDGEGPVRPVAGPGQNVWDSTMQNLFASPSLKSPGLALFLAPSGGDG